MEGLFACGVFVDGVQALFCSEPWKIWKKTNGLLRHLAAAHRGAIFKKMPPTPPHNHHQPPITGTHFILEASSKMMQIVSLFSPAAGP